MSFNKLQSPKYIQKKRKRLIFTVFASSIGALALITFLSIFANFPFFQTQSLFVQGIDSPDSQLVKKIAQSDLEGSYAFFIPKSNIFFYPKSKIIRDIIALYPKIDKVTVYLQGLSDVIISVNERIEKVIVCNGFKGDQENDCYSVDKDAYVFKKRDNDSMMASPFKYYFNIGTSTVTIGTHFIDQSKFNDLQKFIRNVTDLKLNPAGLLIGDDNSYELYIKNMDQSDAVVYFDNRTPFDKTVSKLATFWQNSQNKKIGLTNIPNFEYINLRFGNNVFYLVK